MVQRSLVLALLLLLLLVLVPVIGLLITDNRRKPRPAATGPVILLPFVHLITENG